MARDYSRQGNRTGGKTRSNGKRKPTRSKGRRNAPKKNTRQATGTPGWVWMASGLCIGLTVAAVLYIVTRPTGHPGRNTAPVEPPQPAQATTTADRAPARAQDKRQQPRFAFYEMLPEYDVVISGQRRPTSGTDSDSSTASGDAAAQTGPQPAAAAADKPVHYVIQAGSFSSRTDANRRKARVALLGLQTDIVRAELDSGRVVYRVRSNVIESNNRLTEMLKRLQENGIGTLVLRQGG